MSRIVLASLKASGLSYRTQEKQDMQDIKAYCMKCKTERAVQNVQTITTKNGRPALQGVCPVCGTKMYKFLPRDTLAASASNTPPAA